jgi:hypothetical protein
MSNEIIARLNKLGFATTDVSTTRLTSPIAALMCMPMYMVSNVHGWTDDRQFLLPVLEAHGIEAFLESKAIGAVEAELDIDPAHQRVLAGFLAKVRASDLIIYEYALHTLRMYLQSCSEPLAAWIREQVAKTIVYVAEASGKHVFGGGPKVSEQELSCIRDINTVLALGSHPTATIAQVEVG